MYLCKQEVTSILPPNLPLLLLPPLQDVPALYRKYRLYAQQCASRIIQAQPTAAQEEHADSQQQQQQKETRQRLISAAIEVPACAGSLAGDNKTAAAAAAAAPEAIPRIPMAAADDTGFPPFPLNLLEILAFSKLSRAVGTDVDQQLQQQQQQQPGAATARSAAAAGQGSGSDLHMRTINLVTLKHDAVSPEFWAQIAGHIQLRPQQRQQLEAGWQLYVRAMHKLNANREKLRQQLQRAIDSPAAAAAAAAMKQPQQAPPQHVAAAAVVFKGVGGLHVKNSDAAFDCSDLTLSCGSSSSSASPMAVGMAAAVLTCSSNAPGCFAVQRLCNSTTSCDLQELEALADAVERSLMQGRAVITAFGCSQMMALDNAQMAAMVVAGFPYMPLIRGVVGHLLGKEEMQQ
jgi:hypothetical protein